MYRFDNMMDLCGRPLLLAALLLVGTTLLPDTTVGQPTTDNEQLRGCDNYKELYARSAARKLARALSGQGYRLQAVDLPEQISADNGGHSLTWETFFEKDNRAVGLVDTERKARRSFTLVGTEQGPVVTSHWWPSRREIADGAECRPKSSRIEFPAVSVKSVDVEPFKYWGLRVSWHLPETIDAKASGSDGDLARQILAKAGKPGPNGSDASGQTSDDTSNAESASSDDTNSTSE